MCPVRAECEAREQRPAARHTTRPMAAGRLSSAASRLLRVRGESSSATPSRASSSERSSWSSARACAPSRWAAADDRLVARLRPADRAPRHRRPGPPRAPRRPRRARAAAAAARAPRRAQAQRARNARSLRTQSSRTVRAGPLDAAASRAAPVDARRVAPIRLPRPARRRRAAGAAAGPRRPPRASPAGAATRAAAPRGRAPRTVVAGQQAPVGEGRRRRLVWSSASGDAEADERIAGVLGREPNSITRAPSRRSGDRARQTPLREPRDRAADAAALGSGERAAASVAITPQLEQRGGEQRQRARLARRSSSIASTRRAPPQGRPRGRQLDRAPQLLARIGPTARGGDERQLRVGGAAPVEVRAQRDDHQPPRSRAARRRRPARPRGTA